MKYILATHTGKGFYTSEDRMKMPVFKYNDGLAIIEGDCDEWIKRVNGKEISKDKADAILKQKWAEGRDREILDATAELKRLKSINYDFKDFTS